VIPSAFDYAAPQSLSEAISLLQGNAGQAKVLAGGQSLIPLLKFRLAGPELLVDLRKVPALDHLEERDGHLAIGAMVRESALEHSALIASRYPALLDTSSVVADPLVRNYATVGGNVAHADPANDHPATMLALRATAIANGPNGQRTISIDDFLVDTFETALAPDEVLMELRVPRPAAHSGSAYVKLERKVGDYAIIGVAAQVTLDGEVCAQAGLGLTNAAPRALRPREAETFLVGKRLDEESIRHAAELAASAADPVSDLRGPADYKRAMVRTLTTRALRLAAQRARQA